MKVAVVGAGKTGISTANFLKEKGFEVILNDIKKMKRPENLKEDVKFIYGSHDEEIFKDVDFIVLSPGVNLRNFPVKNKIIIGDVEVFYNFNTSKIIGITGTNGKSTTTSLVGEILNKKYNVFVGGNIGIPVLEAFKSSENFEYSVLELSSFQLELIQNFTVDIGVILNITPDHLDRYRSFEEYVNAKIRLFKNYKKGQIAVLNFDDPVLAKVELKGRETIYFSQKSKLSQGAYLDGDEIVFKLKGSNYSLPLRDIKLKGIHFYEDIMAAGIVALLCGVDFTSIRETIRNFKGLPHRMEYLGEINGVKFYNDSKSTTVDSTYKALKSLENENVILLLGGIHKGERYTKLKELQNVKKVICYGKAKEIIFNDLKDMDIEKVNRFQDAVNRAIEVADNGDVVLLSPACSSFDEFNNFEERGEKFKCMILQQ